MYNIYLYIYIYIYIYIYARIHNNIIHFENFFKWIALLCVLLDRCHVYSSSARDRFGGGGGRGVGTLASAPLFQNGRSELVPPPPPNTE